MFERENVVKAILRKDSVSKKLWLEFEGKPSETILAALKSAGWKWGAFRKQWYSQSLYSPIPAGVRIVNGG